MTNFIKSLLNTVVVSDIICNRYVLQFTSNLNENCISVMGEDNMTTFLIDSSNNLYPNGIIFGEEQNVISTEDINFTNSMILSSGLNINPYETNKVFLYDRFKPLSDIMENIREKINILGFPTFISIYRYNHHQLIPVCSYQLIYDIVEHDSCIDTYVYINENDAFKISSYTKY